MDEYKGANTPMSSTLTLDQDINDVDYAGYKVERKSTLGSCQFLGNSLISWYSKKYNSVALFKAEAEYIAAGMLLNPSSTSYPILGKIFYSNLSFIMIDGNSALRSFIIGQEIIISKTLVNDMLKFSNVADDTTPNILAL
ncbi:uncharacterized protein LOC130812813 [Amaranthus tricolor]|uniref:uncharacterized protein LOC130812813 n=1 Tax=Amaranthus tricolor TaxID=29722 RepID=UPI002589063D|nr:uncharacterized protein LOC130812813 [Amaranthus tricolor]